MGHQHFERGPAAHRIAHHAGARDLQMVEQADSVGTHVRKSVQACVVRLVAMPVAACVVSDNPPAPREPLDHPGLYPMLVRAGAETVNHEHRRAAALVQVMNFYAVGIKKRHRAGSFATLCFGSLYNSTPPRQQFPAACAGARDSGKIALDRNFTTPDTRCHSKPTSSDCIFRSSRRSSARWETFRAWPRRTATPRYGSPRSPGPTLS